MTNYKIEAFFIALAVVGIITGYYIGKQDGYKDGYKVGYAKALETVAPIEKPKADTVQTVAKVETKTTTTVRPKTTKDDAAVVINTTPPVVTASVNGHKYDFKPQSEVLQTGVATTATINVRIPERAWTAGIGYSKDKKPAYLLKAPIKGAVGAWVAGTGKKNFMGGLSISF